jgi:hypothetical protein
MFSPAQLVARHLESQREQRVFDAIVSRAPNSLRLNVLKRLLPDISEERILEALNTLRERDVVVLREHPNTFIPGRVIRSYGLADPTKYPMKESISIGGVEFPRAFHGDMAGAEDLNSFVEAIAQYDATIEKRIGELAASMTRRYWINIATIFALFVAVFALILRASEPLRIDATITPVELLYLKAAELLPLALVLFLFILVLWLLLRRI